MTTGPVRGAALAALALAAALAGCTGAGSGTAPRTAGATTAEPIATPAADPAAAVAAAYDATVAAHTASYTTLSTVDSPVMMLRLKTTGVVDFDRFLLEEARRSSAVVTTSMPGITPGTLDTTTHFRLIGDVSYEDGDAPRLEDPSKRWLRIDRRRADVGGVASLLTRGGHGEPVQAWAHLRGLGAPVEVVGPDRVAGLPTVHYRATLRIARVLTGENAGRWGVRQSLEQGKADGARYDVWLDAAGRLRRVVAPGAGNYGPVDTVFSAFGVPVTVAEPAAADAVDLVVAGYTAPGPTETPTP